MGNVRQRVLLGILGVAVVGSTLAIGVGSDEYTFFDPLIEVKAQISHYFVEEPDDEALQLGAIQGMLEVLGDPYTIFVPAVHTDNFNKDLMGEYVGIGAEVNIVDGWFTIMSPLDGSPAWEAGIMAEDRVVEIDGVSTQDLSMDQCIELLTGTPGTPVILGIERAGDRIDITVVRGHIKVQAVKGVHRLLNEDGQWSFLIDAPRRIAYIRLTQFTPGCADEVKGAIAAAEAEAGGELAGLVLDLRWNPGGLLDEAIRIADLFLDEGVIVSTRGRAYPEKIARAKAKSTIASFPLTVLVNGQSASASEVLSGALVENDRAVVVGSRSFGKGSVQSIHQLSASSGGGMLKITEQRYYLPSGRSIQRLDDSPSWGVDPTPGYFVQVTNDEVADLLTIRRKLEILRAGEPGDTDAPDWSQPEPVLAHLADRQLTAAVEALQAHADTGSFKAHDIDPEAPDQISQAELSALRLQRERLMRELQRIARREIAIASNLGADDEPDEPYDLWPDDADLVGGTVTVTDADGNTLTELEITGDALERWLMDADLKPIDHDEP